MRRRFRLLATARHRNDQDDARGNAYGKPHDGVQQAGRFSLAER
jgi:hypothetical protein